MTDAEEPADAEATDRPSLAEQRGVDAVYGASEDSHLLAEAAVEGATAGERAIDVGTGSGYVASALAEAGVEVVGDAFFMGYDAPWTLPFLRRNEVALVVRD